VRNRAVLAMLVGCGLRRAEIVTVKIEDFQLQEEHWILADLIGKGGHMRTAPVPAWVKVTVDSGIACKELGNGTLFRAIGKRARFMAVGSRRK
jgi:site-specific recombinase XerC